MRLSTPASIVLSRPDSRSHAASPKLITVTSQPSATNSLAVARSRYVLLFAAGGNPIARKMTCGFAPCRWILVSLADPDVVARPNGRARLVIFTSATAFRRAHRRAPYRAGPHLTGQDDICRYGSPTSRAYRTVRMIRRWEMCHAPATGTSASYEATLNSPPSPTDLSAAEARLEYMPGARSRGRIVMLVDNGVHGDSRVQKSAESAAEAGWDVTLLGRSTDGVKHTWTLGLAEVRLLPTPLLLSQPASTHRRPWLRPFAYPPTGIAARRRQLVRAQRAELDVQRAVMRINATAGRPAGFLDRKVLGLRTLANRASGRWVTFRTQQLNLAQ